MDSINAVTNRPIWASGGLKIISGGSHPVRVSAVEIKYPNKALSFMIYLGGKLDRIIELDVDGEHVYSMNPDRTEYFANGWDSPRVTSEIEKLLADSGARV